jgi:hypothetical protein
VVNADWGNSDSEPRLEVLAREAIRRAAPTLTTLVLARPDGRIPQSHRLCETGGSDEQPYPCQVLAAMLGVTLPSLRVLEITPFFDEYGMEDLPQLANVAPALEALDAPLKLLPMFESAVPRLSSLSLVCEEPLSLKDPARPLWSMLSSLRSLRLGGHADNENSAIDVDIVAHLQRAAPALQALSFDRFSAEHGRAVFDALLSSPLLARLHTFGFTRCHLTDADGLRLLGSSSKLAHLREVTLMHNDLSLAIRDALRAQFPHWRVNQ